MGADTFCASLTKLALSADAFGQPLNSALNLVLKLLQVKPRHVDTKSALFADATFRVAAACHSVSTAHLFNCDSQSLQQLFELGLCPP